jgi:MtN3 and saliva related transmembrane protein
MLHGAQHHLHVRKRIHQRHEQYPHPDPFKRVFDKIMYVVAIAGPFATIPQVIQTFETKDVSGMSLVTFVLWFILTIFWLIYGALHKDIPIIVSQAIYLVLNGILIFAILSYT